MMRVLFIKKFCTGDVHFNSARRTGFCGKTDIQYALKYFYSRLEVQTNINGTFNAGIEFACWLGTGIL